MASTKEDKRNNNNNNSNDNVLMLHAPDGADWAQFLSSWLASPQYGIKSRLLDITRVSESPPFQAEYLTSSQALSSSSNDSQPLSSPSSTFEIPQYETSSELLRSSYITLSTENFNRISSSSDYEEGDALYTNDPIFNPFSKNSSSSSLSTTTTSTFSSTVLSDTPKKDNNVNNNEPEHIIKLKNATLKHIDENRICAILISPDITAEETSSSFCVDLNSINEKTTVFLFLGVELAEVMKFFGPLYARVSSCRCCFIDGTEETIRATVVSIIEAYEDAVAGHEDDDDEEGYEDADDVYKVPNFPVQMNKVEKVFPNTLSETDRDVYVLLTTVPESECLVVIPEHSITIPLKPVCERLMSFTMPVEIDGEIHFQLMCQNRIFAYQKIESLSKLDTIHYILTSEVNPQALIATSLGLQREDVAGLDTALAFKLQELASVMTFKSLCPCEEALKNTDEVSGKMWPTLLHFAADLNLPLLCSELLRYPGMVSAACTENRAGEFPSQIAARKGHSQIENELMDFMKRWRREVDPDYVSSGSTSSKASSMTSLNDPSVAGTSNKSDTPGSNSNFSEAHGLRKPLLDLNQSRSHSGTTSGRAPVRSHSDRIDATRSRASYSQRPLPRRPDSPTEENRADDTYSNPDESLFVNDSPHSTSSNSPSAKALKRLGATEEEVRNSVFDPKLGLYSATCPPGSLSTRLFHDDDDDRLSYSSNFDESELAGWHQNVDLKMGHVKDKVKGFFKKIKGNKKSGNMGGLPGKKMKGAKPRRGSEPGAFVKDHKTRDKSYSVSEERDSGSYSDEEKKPQKIFKEKDQPMNRKTSRRVAQARKQRYRTDAPHLPITERSTFKSFVE